MASLLAIQPPWCLSLPEEQTAVLGQNDGYQLETTCVRTFTLLHVAQPEGIRSFWYPNSKSQVQVR